MSRASAGPGEMPLNGAFFCPFPPLSAPRLRERDIQNGGNGEETYFSVRGLCKRRKGARGTRPALPQDRNLRRGGRRALPGRHPERAGQQRRSVRDRVGGL